MLDWNNPAVIGLVVAIPSFILGYLGYRRSVKVDKTTDQSRVASSQVGAVGQVIDGLNQLIDNLQEDNKLLRLSVRELRDKLDRITEDHLTLIKDVAELRAELIQYKIKDTAKIEQAKVEIKTKVEEKLEEIKK
jgi:regulator of replication initiation timing